MLTTIVYSNFHNQYLNITNKRMYADDQYSRDACLHNYSIKYHQCCKWTRFIVSLRFFSTFRIKWESVRYQAVGIKWEYQSVQFRFIGIPKCFEMYYISVCYIHGHVTNVLPITVGWTDVWCSHCCKYWCTRPLGSCNRCYECSTNYYKETRI